MAQLFDDEDYRVPDEVLEASYYYPVTYTTEGGQTVTVDIVPSVPLIDFSTPDEGPRIDSAFDVVATRDELSRHWKG